MGDARGCRVAYIMVSRNKRVATKRAPLPCVRQRGPSVKGVRRVPGLGLQCLEVLLDLLAGGLAGEAGSHLQLAAEGDGGHAHGRVGATPQARPSGSSSTSRCTSCPCRKHRFESRLGKTGVNVCLGILAALTDQRNSRLYRWLVAKGHLSLVCELRVEVCNVFRGKRLPCRWICQPVARTIGQACAGRGCQVSGAGLRRRI